jgi:hypothetical protein
VFCPSSAASSVLQVGAGLRLWTSPNKNAGTPISLDENRRTGDLGFSGNETTLSFWAEWIDFDHGTAEIQLLDTEATGGVALHDTLTFHSFESLIIGLSGETFSNTALGLLGTNSPTAQGTFEIAQNLLKQGFDVQYFDNQTVEPMNILGTAAGRGLPYDTIVAGIKSRHVSHVGIFGYSHGGGATYNLAWALHEYGVYDLAGWSYSLDATAYIDAISFDAYPILVSGTYNPYAETRRPPDSLSHRSWFQHNDVTFSGAPSDPPSANYDLSHSQWLGIELYHSTIDDYVLDRELVEIAMSEDMSTR